MELPILQEKTMSTLCPCGSGKAFKSCCEPIIEGIQPAPTAEALMRSRYTAFTMARVDYLMKSHHPKSRPVKEKEAMRKWAQSVKWLGLVILETSAGKQTDSQGFVTFRAMYMENHQLQQIYERSLFERVNGLWVYVSGVHLK